MTHISVVPLTCQETATLSSSKLYFPIRQLGLAPEFAFTITDACAKEGLVYGLEIEPNLVGETGTLLAELAKRVNHPSLVLEDIPRLLVEEAEVMTPEAWTAAMQRAGRG